MTQHFVQQSDCHTSIEGHMNSSTDESAFRAAQLSCTMCLDKGVHSNSSRLTKVQRDTDDDGLFASCHPQKAYSVSTGNAPSCVSMLQDQYRHHDVAKQWPLLCLLVGQCPGEEQQLCDVYGCHQHEDGIHLQISQWVSSCRAHLKSGPDRCLMHVS